LQPFHRLRVGAGAQQPFKGGLVGSFAGALGLLRSRQIAPQRAKPRILLEEMPDMDDGSGRSLAQGTAQGRAGPVLLRLRLLERRAGPGQVHLAGADRDAPDLGYPFKTGLESFHGLPPAKVRAAVEGTAADWSDGSGAVASRNNQATLSSRGVPSPEA